MSQNTVQQLLISYVMNQEISNEPTIRYDNLKELMLDVNLDNKYIKRIELLSLYNIKKNKDVEKKSLITCSAYLITNTNGVIDQLIDKSLFNHNNVVEYAHINNIGDNIIHKRNVINNESISKYLGISYQIIDVLCDDIVIAGGATAYMGRPDSLWDMSCDVDIFVMDIVNNMDKVKKIIKILKKEKYIICSSGCSVLTAIGSYGKRRIQIIASTASTSNDLINKFDMNYTKSYYDGTSLSSTYSALYDWKHKICTQSNTHVMPKRLIRASIKGFKLQQNSIDILRDTIGWPITSEIRNKYLYNIPCLNTDLPLKVQTQYLDGLGLYPINDNFELIPMGNSYNKLVHKGEVDDYVKNISIKGIRNNGSNMDMGIIDIKSEYMIKLPDSYITFPWECEDDVKFKYTKLTILDDKETELFCSLHDAIIHKLCPDSTSYSLSSDKYINISINVDKYCTWYIDYVKQHTDISLYRFTDRDIICSTGYPVSIVNYNTSIYHVKFKLHTVYVSKNAILPRKFEEIYR